MSDEIKPCPFCGSDDIHTDDCSDTQQEGTMILCRKCGGNIKGWGLGCSYRARKLWNTRTTDARLAEAERLLGIASTRLEEHAPDEPVVEQIDAFLAGKGGA